MNNLFETAMNGTPVYTHEEAHPHLLNDAAKAAIKMMDIPLVPADPSDWSQTRVCETIDLGWVVGFNYRTELKPGMHTFMMCREEGRDWESLMTADVMPTPSTLITSSVIWDAENNHWVLWTNFVGEDDPWPEPGTVRFNKLPEEDKKKAAAWHTCHPLICNKEQVELAMKLGLIKNEWFFHAGEDEPQSLWGLHQPWAIWEENFVFDTKVEAMKAYDKYVKDMNERKNQREWVWNVTSRPRKTWLDEARKELNSLERDLEREGELTKENEKENKLPIFTEMLKNRQHELRKKIEELKLLVG